MSKAAFVMKNEKLYFCCDSAHVPREQAINRAAVRHNWISMLFGQGQFLSPCPAKTQHTPDLLYLNDKYIILKINTFSGTCGTIQKFGVCKISYAHQGTFSSKIQ